MDDDRAWRPAMWEIDTLLWLSQRRDWLSSSTSSTGLASVWQRRADGCSRHVMLATEGAYEYDFRAGIGITAPAPAPRYITREEALEAIGVSDFALRMSDVARRA